MKNPDLEKAEGEGKVVGYQLVKALPSLAWTREDPPPPISSSVALTLFLAFVGFGMGPASGKLYQNSIEISAEPPLKLGLPNLYLYDKNNL